MSESGLHPILATAAKRFRVSPPTTRRVLLARTGVQVVGVWGFALGVLPALACLVDDKLRLGRHTGPRRKVAGAALFALGSATGLSAAWVMVDRGHGTPLPFDAARDLVVAGPYRVVRNPMAVSSIGQSAGIALALGSPTAAAIPISGAIIWHVLIRPAEEAFLVTLFGKSYEDYRRQVRLWVPTWPTPANPVA